MSKAGVGRPRHGVAVQVNAPDRFLYLVNAVVRGQRSLARHGLQDGRDL